MTDSNSIALSCVFKFPLSLKILSTALTVLLVENTELSLFLDIVSFAKPSTTKRKLSFTVCTPIHVTSTTTTNLDAAFTFKQPFGLQSSVTSDSLDVGVIPLGADITRVQGVAVAITEVGITWVVDRKVQLLPV